jgi:hypothetical protein
VRQFLLLVIPISPCPVGGYMLSQIVRSSLNTSTLALSYGLADLAISACGGEDGDTPSARERAGRALLVAAAGLLSSVEEISLSDASDALATYWDDMYQMGSLVDAFEAKVAEPLANIDEEPY